MIIINISSFKALKNNLGKSMAQCSSRIDFQCPPQEYKHNLK